MTGAFRKKNPPRHTAEFESITNLGIREIKIRDGRLFHCVQIFGCTRLKRQWSISTGARALARFNMNGSVVFYAPRLMNTEAA